MIEDLPLSEIDLGRKRRKPRQIAATKDENANKIEDTTKNKEPYISKELLCNAFKLLINHHSQSYYRQR